MIEERNIGLVDMDGVLCNYEDALRRDYNLIRSPNEPLLKSIHDSKESYVQKRIKMIRNQKGWWKNLEPINAGFEILGLLKELDFEIHILTKAPSEALNANTEKAEWVENHIGRIGRDITMHISGDKSIAYGKVLVDDYKNFLLPWLKYRPRGIGIMPIYKENNDFNHERVVKYNGSNIDEVKRALLWAKNRKGPMPKFK